MNNRIDSSTARIGWDGLGKGSWDGLPFGNGEIGGVAWGEENRIGVLLATGDAWDGLCRLPKIGRVMLHRAGAGRHEVDMHTATVKISHVHYGDVRIWADAHAKVVVIEGEGSITVSLDPWRAAPRTLDKSEMHCVDGHLIEPIAIADEPLTIPGSLAWWRCNRTSIWGPVLAGEGLGDWTRTHADPLLHRASGGIVWGEGFTSGANNTLAHGPGHWRLLISVHTAVTADADTFVDGLSAAQAALSARD